MSLTSIYFLGFLFIVALIYFCAPKKYRWVVLLIASYAFYLFSGYKAVIFILFTTISTFFTGIALGRINEAYALQAEQNKASLSKEERKILKAQFQKKKRWVLFAALLLNFGILAFIKYFNFAMDITGMIFQFKPGFELNLILPLGISFYTFQSMGYLIDVYRSKYRPDKNLAKLALFVSFFPQIIQGPISRYDQLANQLYEPHSVDYTRIKQGAQLMLWGFFKKMVIADRTALIVNQVFAHPGDYQGFTIFFSVMVYTLQIYTDFSGGIDIARGAAQILGIDLVNNFERPYFARSIPEYWRRWHITLGAWCRDYIFYPLSLSKPFGRLGKNARKVLGDYLGKLLPVIISQLVVFLTIGIWHGASFKFIAFGLYYGILISIGILSEPLSATMIKALHINAKSFLWRLFQTLRTFFLVVVGRYFSRAVSFTSAISLMGATFKGTNLSTFVKKDLFSLGVDWQNLIMLGMCTVVLFIVSLKQEKGVHMREKLSGKKLVFRWAICLIAIFAVILFGVYGNVYDETRFIYMGF